MSVAGRVFGVLLVALAAACSSAAVSADSKAESEDVPVIDLDDAIAASLENPQGSFLRTIVSAGKEAATFDVLYDIGTGFVDSTVTVPGSDTKLRFIATPDRTLMNHPMAEERCGTPWLEMPQDQMAAVAGTDTGLYFAPGKPPEPYAILQGRDDADEVLRNDSEGTSYKVRVIATSGMSGPALLKRPELRAELEDMTVMGVVQIDRATGTVSSLEVTMSDEVEELIGGPGNSSFRWEMKLTPTEVEQTLPTNVATQDSGCIDE